VKSFEKADTRSVLIGPPPGNIFPVTFQLPAVRPVFITGGVENVATVSSKLKSPWKPTKLKSGVIVVVTTGSVITVEMGTEVSKVAVGRDTVTAPGVGVCAEATPLMSKEAVPASASPFRPSRADERNRFFPKVEKTEVELCIIESPTWISFLCGSNFVAATVKIGCTLLIFFKKKIHNPYYDAFFIRCAAI
jgi:hypothetical protein